MNNNYIKQIFNEGLATTFYQKPKNFINKYIKTAYLKKILSFLLIIIYLIFILGIVIIVFILNFPL